MSTTLVDSASLLLSLSLGVFDFLIFGCKGLLRILAERLYNSRCLGESDTNFLLQHSVSLRSNMLTDQQYFQDRSDPQNIQEIPIGWLAGTHLTTEGLINTETTVSSILGLSIGAQFRSFPFSGHSKIIF